MKTTVIFLSIFMFLIMHLRAEEANPYEGIGKLMMTLDVPREFDASHDFNPVTYVELFDKKALDRAIAKYPQRSQSANKLASLFIAANKASIKKYGQSYYISEVAPAFSALQVFFPDLKALPREPGGGIRMEQIADKLGMLIPKEISVQSGERGASTQEREKPPNNSRAAPRRPPEGPPPAKPGSAPQ